jgi:hypothetical protein
MAYKDIKVPAGGAKISIRDGKLEVPDNPIIPFVEGDGTGRDIWRASVRVFDAAVHHRGFQGIPRRDQGPADHPHRRRDPFP